MSFTFKPLSRAVVVTLCAGIGPGWSSGASPPTVLDLAPRASLAPIWLEWRLAEAGLEEFTEVAPGRWDGKDELRVAPGVDLLVGPRAIGATQSQALAQLEHTGLFVDGTKVALDDYPALAGGKRYFTGRQRDAVGGREGYVAFAGVAAENLDPGTHTIVLSERLETPSGPRTLTRRIRLIVAPYRSQDYLKTRPSPEPLARVDGRFHAPGDSLVITHARLVDGVAETPSLDRALIIQGNRIRAIHPTSEIALSDTAVVLDASGATVLPGLIDAHLHNPTSHEAVWLAEGVTTLVDVSGDSFTMLTLRDQWLRSDEPRPRLLTSGSMILLPDAAIAQRYGTHGRYEVASPEQANAAASALARNGVNLIKIALSPDPHGRSLSDEQICDITDAAHGYGVRVMAHVMSEDAALRAARCRVDILTHMPKLSDEAVQSLASAGVSIVPTLSVYHRRAYAHATSSVRRLFAAGARIGCGNDYPGVPPGLPLEELEALLDSGLTPAQALQAATRVNAEILGVGASLGTLEPGNLADLIVVNGDPLDDLTTLRDLRAVIANGKLVSATARSPGS